MQKRNFIYHTVGSREQRGYAKIVGAVIEKQYVIIIIGTRRLNTETGKLRKG